jgi:ABC-type multidrug transport system permease subunit
MGGWFLKEGENLFTACASSAFVSVGEFIPTKVLALMLVGALVCIIWIICL